MPIATWTRPPLPTAMSQAEYSRPAAGEPPVTTGMAAENVTPPSVDLAYFGPSGESQRRWIVPPASALRHDGATERRDGDRRHPIRRVVGPGRR